MLGEVRTPQQRYDHDPDFRQLVDLIESFIWRAEFTASEVRMAATLAAINYECKHVRRVVVPASVHGALQELGRFRIDSPGRPGEE